MRRSLQRRIAATEELRRFEQGAIELDRALKESLPAPSVPRALHSSIMHAVRHTGVPRAARPFAVRERFAAPALAGLVLLAFCWSLYRPLHPPIAPSAQPQPLVAASTDIELSTDLARAIPAAVLSPLSDELERLNLDLDNAEQFLLASLP